MFRTVAPDCVFNTLSNCQLIETIKPWYFYKSKIKGNLGWSNFHLQDPIWWNKGVQLKSKKFFFYPVWYEKRICHISDLFLGHNCVKTFEDLVLEFDIPISDRRKYNSWRMVFIWIGFRNPKNIQENIFDKISSSLVSEKKVPKNVYSVLRNQASVEVETNGLIVWMLWMRWNRMIFIMPTSSAPLKPSWGLFTLNLFIRQSALTNFSIEWVELILPIVTFVIIPQKLFYTYFLNVKKFPPFGMNYVFWLIMFLGNPLLSQILKKNCLVSQTSQNMTVVFIFSFYAWNFIFTDANFSKPIPILSHF